MSSVPFIGIQVDRPSREGCLREFCDRLQEQAFINQFVCFLQSEEMQREMSRFEDFSLQPAEPVVDGAGRTALDRLHEAAKERGIGVFLGGGEPFLHLPEPEPRYQPYLQVDCFGRKTHMTCVNHPEWHAYQEAYHRDLMEQNPFLVGFMFMHERSGPMQQLFFPEVWQGFFTPGCFCEHCTSKAQNEGIDVERAREGFREMVALLRDGSPVAARDGTFTQFWRLLTSYPETMAWEHFQWEALHRYRTDLAAAMREARPGITIGYHFQHCSHTGNLPWRAGDDPERIQRYADWVKPSIYPGASGARYRNLVQRYQETVFADLSEDAIHDVLSGWFNREASEGREAFGQDAAAEDRQTAFSTKWCETETRRIKEGSAPLPCYAGLGIGIPGGEKADTASHLAACAGACLDGGADGFLLSRHSSEMPDEHLAAVGRVIRERLLPGGL